MPQMAPRGRRLHTNRRVITLRRAVLFLACLCGLFAARQIILYEFSYDARGRSGPSSVQSLTAQGSSGRVDLNLELPEGVQVQVEDYDIDLEDLGKVPDTCKRKQWNGLYFMHVPKAGGTFFRSVLKRYGALRQSFSWCHDNEKAYTCPSRTQGRPERYLRQFHSTFFSQYLWKCSAVGSHSDISLLKLIIARKKLVNKQLDADDKKKQDPSIFLAINVRDPVARIVSLYGHLKLYSHAALGTVEQFAQGASNTMTQQLLANECNVKGIGSDDQKMGLYWDEIQRLPPNVVRYLVSMWLQTFCVVMVQEYPLQSLELMNAAFGWELTAEQMSGESDGVILKGHAAGKAAALMRVLKETRNKVSLQLREWFQLDQIMYDLAVERFWRLRNATLAGEDLYGQKKRGKRG